MDAVITDMKLLHPHHLLGQSGAQTKRESVLIGSQLIGTAQIKHIETLHGSHISPRNEFILHGSAWAEWSPWRRNARRLFVIGSTADWDSSDQTHKNTTWQSHFSKK